VDPISFLLFLLSLLTVSSQNHATSCILQIPLSVRTSILMHRAVCPRKPHELTHTSDSISLVDKQDDMHSTLMAWHLSIQCLFCSCQSQPARSHCMPTAQHRQLSDSDRSCFRQQGLLSSLPACGCHHLLDLIHFSPVSSGLPPLCYPFFLLVVCPAGSFRPRKGDTHLSRQLLQIGEQEAVFGRSSKSSEINTCAHCGYPSSCLFFLLFLVLLLGRECGECDRVNASLFELWRRRKAK